MAGSHVDIPHHYQQTDHTCGPAALRMILAAFGDHREEEELAAAVGTTETIGTRQRHMKGFLEAEGFPVLERHTDTRLEEIAGMLDQGHVVLVCYHMRDDEDPADDTDHYALVQRIGHGTIHLLDPYKGPDTTMTTAYFEDHWLSLDDAPGRKDRWLLGVNVTSRTESFP